MLRSEYLDRVSNKMDKLPESTTLSRYVWQMKDRGRKPEMRWSKLSSAKPFSLGGRSCPLCLADNTAIVRDTSGQ